MPSPVYNNYANIITFSRGTNATLTDSTGKITYAPANILTYSEQFDNGYWSKVSATISANSIIAPDGQTTADTLSNDTANNNHGIYTTISYPINYILSVYAKAGTTSFVGLTNSSSATPSLYSGAVFNLSNGTVSNSNNCSATITSVGNGWYRCSISNLTVAGSFFVISIREEGATAPWIGYIGTNKNIYIWGAQLEPVTYQTTPSTYVATTTAAYYGPRLDYDPVTLALKGLLVEEGRTNLALQSSDIMTTWTTTGAFGNWAAITRTADQYTAPDGTLTADQISGTGAQRKISQRISVSPSTTYTFSIWVKCVSGSFQLDLATGNSNVLVSPSVATSSILTPATTPNFTRYSVTYTVPASGVNQLEIGVVTTDAGSCVGGIWGAQLEAGAFATSYIPTTTASVARSADVASMTGANFSSWFNANAGTMVAELNGIENSSALQVPIFNFGDSNNRIEMRPIGDSATQSRMVVLAGGVSQADTNSSGVTSSTSRKVGMAYSTNDFYIIGTGGTGASDTSGSLPTVSVANIGTAPYDANLKTNGWIKSIQYYPRRLSNAQLQALTS